MLDINFITDNFIKKYYQKTKPSLAFAAKTKDQFFSWQKELKGKIKQLLGDLPEPSDLKPDLL